MPELFCPKQGWNPNRSDAYTEATINEFESKLKELFRAHRPRLHTNNLTQHLRTVLQTLRDDKSIVIFSCDKNLGPAIIERERYIELAWHDHLHDTSTYQRLSDQEFALAQKNTKGLIESFISQLDATTETKQEAEFLRRRLQRDTRTSQLYLMAKVHKKPPLKTRPIISCCGSPLSGLAQWTNVKLQPAFKGLPSFTRDSEDLLQKLRNLGPLPRHAKLFTADAIGMYTNIHTQRGISAVRNYLSLFDKHARYSGREIDLICSALEIVMENNLFQFGDTNWLQLQGTAMGTDPAPPFASIYYGNHEATKILPNFQHCLPFYKRFIDDIFGVWTGSDDEWEAFKASLNVDILEWDCSKRSKSVIFLDLVISISENSTIVTRLYEKPMNLHLYIPSRSAHPKSVLKGLIIGQVRRFRLRNTYFSDFKTCVINFFGHLRDRGYSNEQLQPLFIDALERLNLRSSALPTTRKAKSTDQATTILVVPYHPSNVPTRYVHQAYNSTLRKLHGHRPTPLGTIASKRLIIAHKRPKNLGNILTRSTLPSFPNQVEVSDVLNRRELDHD